MGPLADRKVRAIARRKILATRSHPWHTDCQEDRHDADRHDRQDCRPPFQSTQTARPSESPLASDRNRGRPGPDLPGTPLETDLYRGTPHLLPTIPTNLSASEIQRLSETPLWSDSFAAIAGLFLVATWISGIAMQFVEDHHVRYVASAIVCGCAIILLIACVLCFANGAGSGNR